MTSGAGYRLPDGGDKFRRLPSNARVRGRFVINWTNDRGANPDGCERLNDRHYMRAEKPAARKASGSAADEPNCT